MRIQSGNVAMEGYSQTAELHQVSSQLTVTTDTGNLAVGSVQSDALTLSEQGIALSQSTTKSQDKLKDILSERDYERLKLLEQLIEKLTGRSFKFRYLALGDLNAADDPPSDETREKIRRAAREARLPDTPPKPVPTPVENVARPVERVGWGVHFSASETHYQYESTAFSAKGQVTTEDGRTVDFNLNYSAMHESWSSTSIDFKAGDALIDPLMIRLDSQPLKFSDEKVSFDLNLDHKEDAFRVPVDNAGFLFMDLDHNGKVTNGSELFGPKTGSGYGELAQLDEDHNGWLDENDKAFNELRIWVKSSDGSDKILGLAQAGVGAIFVSGVSGGISMKDDQFNTVAKTKANGFYLKENGQAGLMHEVDLVI